MAVLIAGLIVFFAIHSLPTFVPLRASLVQRFGLKGYKLGFTAVALVGFILIIIGKAQAEFIHVYAPPAWGRHAAMLLVLIAFILLPAAHMPTNIKRFTRHPMLWGVVAWATAHLLANGDQASLLLFGSFLVYSLLDMVSANLRGAQFQKDKLAFSKDARVIVAGLVAYGIFLVAHPYLFGPKLVG